MIDSKSESVNFIESIEAKLNKKPDFVEFDIELIKRLNASALNSQRAATYYMGRGITKDSVERYLLGYSESQDMVTIPVHSPDGMCLGFVGRSVEGKEFKNTPGLPKAKTMFNLFRAKRFDKVFVVESSFDAIRLEQVGAHAVATLGASVSGRQRATNASLPESVKDVSELSDDDLKKFVSQFDDLVANVLQ
jgi:DNA primase